MWLFFALGSAFFAGITAVLAKIGIENVNSTLATALRTVVVLAFSWLMVFVVGSQGGIAQISGTTLLFLMLSGLSTGASWLCYFKALQLGDVNKVAPIDKSSTVLTILLAFIFLGEPVSIPQALGVVGIGVGTLLMIAKKEVEDGKPHSKSLAGVRLSFGGVRQPDLHLWEDWRGECGVQPGHGHPHHCGAGDGLGDGVRHRGAEGHPLHWKKELGVPVPLGDYHGALLAVLLPGFAGRPWPAWWCPLIS